MSTWELQTARVVAIWGGGPCWLEAGGGGRAVGPLPAKPQADPALDSGSGDPSSPQLSPSPMASPRLRTGGLRSLAPSGGRSPEELALLRWCQRPSCLRRAGASTWFPPGPGGPGRVAAEAAAPTAGRPQRCGHHCPLCPGPLTACHVPASGGGRRAGPAPAGEEVSTVPCRSTGSGSASCPQHPPGDAGGGDGQGCGQGTDGAVC